MLNSKRRSGKNDKEHSRAPVVYRDAAAYKAKDLYDYLLSLEAREGDPEWEARVLARKAYVLLLEKSQKHRHSYRSRAAQP